MKEIWIDNYSISELEPGYYCISKNGTPCAYFIDPKGLSELDMRQVLLNYIQGPTEIKAGDYDE